MKEQVIQEAEQERIKRSVEESRTSRVYDEDRSGHMAHKTLSIEEMIMSIVRRGDSVALKRYLTTLPRVSGGEVAGDELRQMKNIFIVTATLVSRAAIHGGMNEDDAFSLSDAFIQRAEQSQDSTAILNLQYNMLFEFTEQVEKLRRLKHVTRLSLEVANYVRHRLSEPIRVEKMAEDLFLSRPYLSQKFKKETGVTLTDFILSEKTEEAKRLLRYSERPLLEIGESLCFSSGSHFSRVFKKYAGVTPGEYREQHRG